MKAPGSTGEGHWKLGDLSAEEGEWNSMCSGEMRRYMEGTPVAKAALWSVTDAEARKRGEQTGLDTLVVHAVNDEC